VSPEKSVFDVIKWSTGPISFETIAERVQARRQFSRGELAASLAALITKRRVFLNQERTGFVAVRRDESDKRVVGRANTKAVRGLRLA
jgi:predicted transcriptional regulator